MAIVKAKARQTTSVSRIAEGEENYLKALRDGTLNVAAWIGALSLEGRVFTVNAGTLTSTVAFGATVVDTDEFDLHVIVPAGVVIIPLELMVHFDAFGTKGIVECCMVSGSGSVPNSGGALYAESSNVNSGFKSACTITNSDPGGGTALQTNVKEIWREGAQVAVTLATITDIRRDETYRWRAMDSGILDVVGPNQQLAVWASAQAGNGFITLKYIELPASAIK